MLRGWIDFNNNGRWDAEEYAVSASIPDNSTNLLVTLSWTDICNQSGNIPFNATALYMRLRVSTNGNNNNPGPANNNDRRAIADGNNAENYLLVPTVGEIEDYRLQIKADSLFSCTTNFYQVADGILYSYTPNGTRTTIAPLCHGNTFNALGFDSLSGYMWAYAPSLNQIVRISADGAITGTYTIPNLPSTPYNIGDIDTSGYMYLYRTNQANYYTVDINPSRATYLRLVNPTNNYTLQASAPYGVALSNAMEIADWAYNPSDGFLYGLTSASATNPFRVIRLQPKTGNVALLPGTVSGGGVQGGSSPSFGATFFDIDGYFYVFNNPIGHVYRVDLSNVTATVRLTSVANPSSNNDGASCALIEIPLTLSLLYFDAVKQNESVLIKWTTANEKYNLVFEIEHSVDVNYWSKKGMVFSTSEKNKSQDLKNNYEFVDNYPISGINFYRLKQVDQDGKIEYGPVAQVMYNPINNGINIYPNPADKKAISITGINANDKIEIYNMAGKLIKTFSSNKIGEIDLDINELNEGIYLLSIIRENNITINKKLVVLR